MSSPVIIESVRTPIGRLGGTLINERADKLAAHVLKEIQTRSEVNDGMVDEIILGQAKQTADLSNVARVSSLLAGYPEEIPSYTVHRQCGSGLQAINNAALQIIAGLGNTIIAGGVESMSTAPFYTDRIRFGNGSGNLEFKDSNIASQPGSQPTSMYEIDTMGSTAEILAKEYNLSREEQDEYALLSQTRASEAINKNIFSNEIIPYTVNKKRTQILFEEDEHPRSTSLDKLAQLKPAFKHHGSVTAGNSSGRNDGASALLIMNEKLALEQGLSPKVRIIAQASVGVNPYKMGLGPIYATRKALKQTNLSIDDIDIIELNEAFAAQALVCIKELNLPIEKVNPNGGAIALGHPIGATGSILMTKLIHELERTSSKYGLVTLCIAGGLGIATIVENLRL